MRSWVATFFRAATEVVEVVMTRSDSSAQGACGAKRASVSPRCGGSPGEQPVSRERPLVGGQWAHRGKCSLGRPYEFLVTRSAAETPHRPGRITIDHKRLHRLIHQPQGLFSTGVATIEETAGGLIPHRAERVVAQFLGHHLVD